MSAFDRLHPALQHHIVNSLGWSSLRPVQALAIEPVLAGANPVILAPTAGGKSEAAFFPLISQTLSQPWGGLSVLYVSPLKALLNNQAERLERYYGLVGRQAAVWHGDISASQKKRLLAAPPDCLLTTPESLEVMLISGQIRHDRLFANLRALVVDEVHAFAGDDRGWHLLALLQRLGRLAGRDIQRLGLSASVGNPGEMVEWLSAGSSRPRAIVQPDSGAEGAAAVELDSVGSLANAAKVIASLYRGEKRLVFCESRSRVEQLAAALRAHGTATFVVHSSLGLAERRQAERAFAQGRDCAIVATSALELGIDVGDLDRVIQIDAPATVSSFLQRMGRTGRRPGTQRNCLFLATSEEGLLRGAGLIELWRGGFIEPVCPPPQPAHILAQQLMALALQERGIGRTEWFAWIRAVPAFQAISAETVDSLLAWMLERQILWEDAGILWLGQQGQETYGRRNFLELFAVFTSPPLFSVLHGRHELGSVHESTFLARADDGPPVLLLGGRSWLVTHLDWKRRRAYVQPSQEQGRSRWRGEGQLLSFALCQAIRSVLVGAEEPPFWSRRARTQIAAARAAFPWLDPGGTSLVCSRGDEVSWWTFAGGRANAALAHTLERRLGSRVLAGNFGVRLQSGVSRDALEARIRELRSSDPKHVLPALNQEGIEGLKFSECLPSELALRVVQARLADVAGVAAALSRPLRFVFDG